SRLPCRPGRPRRLSRASTRARARTTPRSTSRASYATEAAAGCVGRQPIPPGGIGAIVAAVSATLRRTPLFERHVEAGARMVPFAGWEMPVQYEGVIPEHRAVRTDAGVFDVSHMGEIEVEGPTARELLQATLSNDIDKLAPGDAQYTLLTTDAGGIVDDL